MRTGKFFPLCFLLLCIQPPAFTHRLNLFAWNEGDERVCAESWFSKISVARHVPFTVQDANGEIVLQGTADESGRFCFPRPVKGALLLVVNAGEGHRGEFTLSAPSSAAVSPPIDSGLASSVAPAPTGDGIMPSGPETHPESASPQNIPQEAQSVDVSALDEAEQAPPQEKEDLRALIREEIRRTPPHNPAEDAAFQETLRALIREETQRALPPMLAYTVERKLQEREDGPHARDIVAGLALIAGLAALFGVWKTGRKQPEVPPPSEERPRERGARAS